MNKNGKFLIITLFSFILILSLSGCKNSMDSKTQELVQIFTIVTFAIGALAGFIAMFGGNSPIVESAGGVGGVCIFVFLILLAVLLG